MRIARPLFLFAFVAEILALPLITKADIFGQGENRIEIDFVMIGDPGNPGQSPIPDRYEGYPFGQVEYNYRIGKFEISRQMIEKANAERGLGITLHSMEFVTGGPRPAMPATGVSWNEAARFVNWLNTSEGHPPAYKFDTQPGDEAYDVNESILLWEAGESGYDEDNRFRNRLAVYFLPSLNEWHKAAYYDPSANGGAGGYWDYPNGSDDAPLPVSSGSEANTAVYLQTEQQGPADVTAAGGLSPYGVMGLGGNVYELTETWSFSDDAFDGMRSRWTRGGNWYLYASRLASRHHLFLNPSEERFGAFGFRVASIVPEPSSLPLATMGLLTLLMWRREPQRHYA